MKAEAFGATLAFPQGAGRLQHVESAHDIGLKKHTGPVDGPVHMAFSGQVHDGIKIVLNKELRDQGCVTNIPLDKRVALVGFDVP